ncbi:Major facilitator superfamily transporter [Acididesulfobacillus acetoxydans]|uniref:Major facilitator superfamily transporter n=1 Tax=Acididesulfobacillus acetoxydans TaxID=1561005 RepID=A0A8S0W9R0_9FIRM|nr:MFS transporter [Acididesulfobacillus acetoxydans]CAA7602799.1 Major facilitator superfamily transporter [Acididesulfobacillus acetoxydans]CEJ06344.1 Major facilitator transporter [Acididesulfobacillus acetoxydans]
MKRKYLIEFILFFSYALFAMAWSGGDAFMAPIMKAMGIHNLASASFISTSVTFAKIVGTAIAAWVALKLGIRNAFSLASLMIAMSILTPFSANYSVLLASRFLMGLGGALVVVYFNPIVMQWFEPEERPLVNGLNAVAFNVGTAIVMFFFKNFIGIFGGWRQTLVALSLASIVFFVLWLVFGKYKEDKTASPNVRPLDENYSFIDGLKDPFNWKFALTYSGLLAFYIVLFTFYPTAGISQAKIVILMGIVGAVLGIIYSRKVAKRIPVIKISGLIQIVSIIGLNFSGNNATLATISAAVLGIFMFLPMTALVTLAQEMPNMTPRKISVTFSLFWSISYIVATVVPTLFGAIVDANHGDFKMAFVFITIVECSFFVGSFFLPEPSKLRD